MTQEERRFYLISALQEEMPQYAGIPVPPDEEGQGRLLRALMNVRPPLPAAPAFLRVQDQYLTQALAGRGVVDAGALPAPYAGGRIALWRGDITRLQVGAIVNAANSGMLGCFQPCHSCIDNIIHTMAGVQLRLECDGIMRRQGMEEPTGQAKLTRAYNLPCAYVLHTVGPIVSGPLTRADEEALASCYRSCLELAARQRIASIAFCCISTGVFCFPQRRAAEIALETVCRYLERHSSMERVIFDVYTQRDEDIYAQLLAKLP